MAGESDKQASPVGKQISQQSADQYLECVICMNEEAAYAIIPCGHLCLCQVPILLFLISWLTYTYIRLQVCFHNLLKHIYVCMYVCTYTVIGSRLCIDSCLFKCIDVCFPPCASCDPLYVCM